MTTALHRVLPVALCLAILAPADVAAHDGKAPAASGLTLAADLRQARQDPATSDTTVPGFLRDADSHAVPRGIALHAASLALAWRQPAGGPHGLLEAGLHAHDNADSDALALEQAWIGHDAGRLGLRAGRQFVALGLRNESHGMDAAFPLDSSAARVFLGGHYRDDGVRLDLQVHPRLQAGLGAWRGRFPAGGARSDGNAAFSGHLDWRAPDDTALLLDLRLSGLVGEAALRPDRDDAHSHDPFSATPVTTWFSGDTRLGVVSLQARWPAARIALLAEHYARREQGALRSDTLAADYRGTQSGLQTELAWSPQARWQLAARHVRLAADNRVTGNGAATLATQAGLTTGATPREYSLAIAWYPAQRQVLRLQWLHATAGVAGDTLLLQYALEHAWPLP